MPSGVEITESYAFFSHLELNGKWALTKSIARLSEFSSAAFPLGPHFACPVVAIVGLGVANRGVSGAGGFMSARQGLSHSAQSALLAAAAIPLNMLVAPASSCAGL